MFVADTKQRGFSLFELLVVFMLIGLAMSLVSPMVTKIYEQQQARNEMRLLKQYVRKASLKAVLLQEDIVMNFSKQTMTIHFANKAEHSPETGEQGSSPEGVERDQHVFTFISFPTQNVVLRRSGFLSDSAVKVYPSEKGDALSVGIRGVLYAKQAS